MTSGKPQWQPDSSFFLSALFDYGLDEDFIPEVLKALVHSKGGQRTRQGIFKTGSEVEIVCLGQNGSESLCIVKVSCSWCVQYQCGLELTVSLSHAH